MKKNIKKSITLKLSGILVLSITFLVILYNLYFFNFINNIREEYNSQQIDEVKGFIETSYNNPLWNMDMQMLDNLNISLLKRKLFYAINIYSNEDFIFCSFTNEKDEIIKKNTPYKLPKNEFKNKMSIKIHNFGEVIGKVEIFYDLEYFAILKKDTIRHSIYITSIFIIISITLLFYLINQIFLNRLKKLVKTITTISDKQDYNLEINDDKTDEISDLYNAFNEMIAMTNQNIIAKDKYSCNLEKTQKKLSSIIENMPSMLITVNQNLKIKEWNKAVSLITDLKKEEVKDRFIYEIIPFFEEQKKVISNVYLNKKNIILSRKRIKINNMEILGDVIFYIIEKNNSAEVAILIKDNTALYEKQQQLIQSQKMEIIGNLAGGLAHDFNNVLGGITGTISIIKHKLNDLKCEFPESFLELFDIIEHSGTRAVGIVRQLLTLSKKKDKSLKIVELNYILMNIFKIIKNSFDKAIDIRFDIDNKNAYTMGDPIQLEQVFLNLCVNANHAMTIMRKKKDNYGGTLIVNKKSVQIDKLKYWQLNFSDTGVGIPDNIKENIFDPYFSTKEESGTGLGLAMVYSIIKDMKGFIKVESEIGKGSTFKIFLPVFEGDNSQKEYQKTKILKKNGVVLVIDDEKVMRTTAEIMLCESGYEVFKAENAIIGIEIYKKNINKIDIVLLDYNMPKLNGIEAYKKLKKLNPEINILLTSGNKEDKNIKVFLNETNCDFIEKPFTIKTLYKKITSILK